MICPSGLSLHRLLHQLCLGLGEKSIRRLAVNLFAPDLQHDRNGERRDVIKRFMDDSALDAREHFSKPAHVQQAGRRVSARGAQQNVVGLMAARVAQMLSIGSLIFQHEPSAKAYDGEIAGHLHPLARVARRGRGVSRCCFAGDGKRLVMPAFGAYAGGLNIRDRAIVTLFGALSFTVHLLGDGRLYAIPAARCLSD